MKFDLVFDQTFPHPIEVVWRALTDSAALTSWLGPNDFVPRIGCRFSLRNPAFPGWRGWAECEVLELDPPRRMVWSWRSTDAGEPTMLTFELSPVANGTRLKLEHAGDIDPTMVDLIRGRWPAKLRALRGLLEPATPQPAPADGVEAR